MRLVCSCFGYTQGSPNEHPLRRRHAENGKIAEHWDTLETIPPQSEWKNQNGKFGF